LVKSCTILVCKIHTNPSQEPTTKPLTVQQESVPVSPPLPSTSTQASSSEINKSKSKLPLLIGNLLVVTVAIAGMWAYKNYLSPTMNSVENTPMVATVGGQPPAVFVDEDTFENSRSYSIQHENINFRYPATWTLVGPKSGDYPTFELNSLSNRITLTSPNNFVLTVTIGMDGLGGACDEACQANNIKNAVLSGLTFYGHPLFVVMNGEKANGANPGRNTAGTTMITGSFTTNSNLDGEEFKNSPDVAEAIEILETFKYTE